MYYVDWLERKQSAMYPVFIHGYATVFDKLAVSGQDSRLDYIHVRSYQLEN
jgi:hypothetical protein